MDSTNAQILVVEDDPTLAMGLVSALKKERFDVTHVDNGEAALDAVRASTPSLILCDRSLARDADP